MTHTIYRFEHHDIYAVGSYNKIGEGCYRNSNILNDMYSKHRDGKHPSLVQDMDYEFVDADNHSLSDYFCACSSVESLRKWFWGFNTELRNHGYVVAEYEVTDSILSESGKQLFFLPKSIISRKVLA